MLQKFIMAMQTEEKDKKNIKTSVFDDFNFLDEASGEKYRLLDDLTLKPPVLFTRPRTEDLKEMMRTYFEAKKIF